MIDNQAGTYFNDVYTNLQKRLPEFPSSDPSPNLQNCISNANFVRAEMLARQHNLSLDVITHLREMVILQYIIDFMNEPGLQKLIKEYNLSTTEVERLVGLIELEKKYPCVSSSQNNALAIDENWAVTWQRKYDPIIQQIVREKLSFWTRFIGWISELFKGKSKLT